jgi:hypothetical protein
VAGCKRSTQKKQYDFIFAHNASSRDMGIADDRASRWRDGRNAGTQGCKWEKRMQVERKTCLRGMQRERLGDGRVDGVEAQPTRGCPPRQNCSHISVQ